MTYTGLTNTLYKVGAGLVQMGLDFRGTLEDVHTNAAMNCDTLDDAWSTYHISGMVLS